MTGYHTYQIAMVGKKKWQEWVAKVMKLFTSIESRYFDLDDKDQAMDWIKSNSN